MPESILRQVMQAAAPKKSIQKTKPYRPTLGAVVTAWHEINQAVFSSQLQLPNFKIKRLKRTWGLCAGYYEPDHNGARCEISLNANWYSHHWMLNVLSHEMVHQWQWECQGRHLLALGMEPVMDHGYSFKHWAPQLKQHGLTLCHVYDDDWWFDHGDFIDAE